MEPFVEVEARFRPGTSGGVVVRKLCQREIAGPVVLVVVDVQAEIAYDDLVQSLCLSIGLGVVGGRQVLLDAEGLGEILPEVRGELVPRSETMSEGAPCLENTC